ncbi:MAG: chromosome segregation protein SMC [Clostridia bacterium]|nr:chromosome segregation protein SMC [Clostridia bacterium]
MNAFKQLEMIGFKSFADKITINFDGGITAIVGPNGCGKSNVGDAIRWVLGEQSSKTLRGKSMQDVIFAGTEKRKKLSYCEVTIVFDNTNKWFNVEYDEISITRKLFRSGESEYYINKKPCRLKDITDLLYDSGIGRDGYSIIGQGKVDEIINSKPEDRRSIFEDAAGISKFKAKKLESERRLERYRDNMTRLRDIVLETERHIGPLKKQSEDAKLYLEYKTELKDLEINNYLYTVDNANQSKQEILDKLQGLQEAVELKQNDLSNLKIKYDSSMDEISKTDRNISAIRDDILNYTVQLEKRQGEQNLLNERLSHLKEQSTRSAELLQRYTLDESQRKTLLENLTQERDNQLSLLNKQKSQAEAINTQYLEVMDSLTRAEGDDQDNQRNMLANLTRLAEIKASASGLNAKIDALNQNKQTEQRNLDALIRAQNSNNTFIANSRKSIESVQTRVDNLATSIESKNNQLTEYTANINALNEKLNNDRLVLSNAENKITLLKSLQAEYEGYGYAVRRLLKDSATNLQLKSNIMGVVGNVIEVPERYQTAIEMALGSAIQNIITADESRAQSLVDYLKATRAGRATFMPLTSVKSRDVSYEYNPYSNHKGCIGIASQLIKYDKVYERAIASLLGGTVIVDTLDNAVAVAKASRYTFRIVTLEGDILSPQGTMTGGSKKSNDVSILGKETEINNCNALINNLKKDIASITDNLNKLNIAKDKLAQEIENINEELNSAKIELSSLTSIHSNLLEKQQQIESDIADKKAFLDQLDLAINDLSKNLGSLDTDCEESFEKADQEITSRQSVYAELKARRDKFNNEMTVIKVKIAETEEKLRNLNSQIMNLQAEIESNNDLVKRAESEYNDQKAIYEQAFKMQADTLNDEESLALKARLAEAEDKIAHYDEYKTSLNHDIRALDEQKNNAQVELARLQNRVVQEENRKQKFDQDIEALQERIYEEYSMIYSDCLPFKKADYDAKQGAISISKLKTKINALGSINVAAIDQFESENARYIDLTKQIADLEKAEADTVSAIKELSDEMTTKFNTEFEKINKNFTEVFRELFGGGNAKLELLDNENDPLNAGVDIIVEPPGKKLQSITLMSGGEKALTAIAILFAILKLKAMPFCLLDEIEAALDDANVERFAKYLHRFSAITQFIVITHRKPTMELAHSLYGVTMEEKGVSKTVSVSLADVADKLDKEAK